MADQSDIETALAAAASAALYPAGTTEPSAIGAPCRIYRGWPEAAALDADLAEGWVNVSVFGIDAGQRSTTRYMDEWRILAPATVTLAATVTGNSVTFTGTAAAGLLAGVRVDTVSFVHQVGTGETPDSVAAALAHSIPGASVTGAMLTVPGAGRLLARVVAAQPALLQTRRQQQSFRLTCWCPDPATRDLAAGAIDGAMAQIRFLSLPDGTVGRLLFAGSTSIDRAQASGMYRRDLIYSVEYPTTLIQSQPSLLFADITLGNADAQFGEFLV